MVLITIAAKSGEDKETVKKQNIQQQSLNSLANFLSYRNRKLKRPPPDVKSTLAHIAILLILAGDIKPNPGPTVTCETCHKTYELQL